MEIDISKWLPTFISILVLLGTVFLRSWIKAGVEKSLQYHFDEKLEKIRASLRVSEEQLKSDLRAKEGEIAALRNGILDGKFRRQSLLDKRRLEGVEKVWAAVIALAPFKSVSAMMASIKFDAAAKRAPQEANLRRVFEMIVSPIKEDDPPKNPAISEQPFLSPLAWAYFSAYQTIVVSAYFKAKLLATSTEDVSSLIKTDGIRQVIKVALPELSEFIDKNEPETYHYLLDELEKRLLAELRNMLEGDDVDQVSIKKVAEINKAIAAVTTEEEKNSPVR